MPAATSKSAAPIAPPRTRNFAWLWLAYTGFLFIDPVLTPPNLYLWLSTFAVLFLFIAIFYTYFRAADCGRKDIVFWMIAATMALGLFTFPWNNGGITFFVYTAAFLPFTLKSARRVLLLFVGEALIIYAEGFYFHTRRDFLHISWPNTVIALFITLIVGVGNMFFAEQKRNERLLHAAQEENHALAAVAERERIARDLHDVLGHTLSVIVLKAELAGRLISQKPDPDTDTVRAAAEVADIERITRTALSEVREAIGGYRARGLSAEIEAARRTLDAAGVILVTESAPQSAASLTPQEETVLSLALREAVTNIVRHARATTCTLRFVATESGRRLIVEDNGRHQAAHEGNGLRGMRERIESLGGRLVLERDHGTRVSIDLPPMRRMTTA